MATTRCPNCSEPVRRGDDSCPSCGNDFRVTVTETTEVTAASPSDTPDFAPGQTFAGRYTLIEKIGAGGMGVVYKAIDRTLDGTVTLKLIQPSLSRNPSFVERFKREARITRQITHPNICRVHDIGESAGILYLSMEWIEGETLEQLLRKTGTLSAARALEIVSKIALALQAAHEKGIVHRDLKPANVMIDHRGTVHVLDFGLALEEGSRQLTGVGVLVGTPLYMSPEQRDGSKVDARTDLYALGLILLEMLTGRRSTADPALPDQVPEEVHPMVAPLVRRLLAWKPDDRVASAAETRAALDGLRENPAISGVVSGADSPDAAAAPRGWIWAVAVVLLLAAGAVSWWIYGPGKRTSTRARAVASLVALPATVHGGDEHRFLSDAIPASLSTYLAKGEGLMVKAPPSAAEMERLEGGPERIAEIYGVDAVLESTVTAQASLFTVNVRLVDPVSHDLLWSRQYEGTPAQYLDMVRQAADGLRRTLGHDKAVPSVAGLTASSEAELAFRQGQYFSNRYNERRREEDQQAARANFLKALELDPGMADAAGELGFLSYLRVEFGDRTAIEELDRWSSRALEIDRSSSMGWVGRAHVAYLEQRQEQMVRHALEAVRTDPDSARAHVMLGFAGGGAISCPALSRAVELDPLYLGARGALAACLLFLGRNEEAWRVEEESLRIEPEEPFALLLSPPTLLGLGRSDKARESFAALERMADDGRFPAALADLEALRLAMEEGDIDRADILEATRRAGEVSPYAIPLAKILFLPELVARGWKEQALALVEAGPTPMDYEFCRSLAAGLGDEPAFQAALVRSRDWREKRLAVLEEARRDGKLPEYLEGPVEQMRRTLAEDGASTNRTATTST